MTATVSATRRPRPRTPLALRVVVVAALAAALATLGPVPPASAEPCPGGFEQPFTDVPLSNPFCREIVSAKSHGAVHGFPDGSFGPAQVITRQQAVVMLWNAANADALVVPTPCAAAPFTDVPVDHPFCPQIRDAAEAGIVNGYGDGTFRPHDPIARGAAAAILFRFPEGPPGVVFCISEAFPDVPPAHPFCGEVTVLSTEDVIVGYPDGTFRPAEPVTRQAFVGMLVGWIAVLE